MPIGVGSDTSSSGSAEKGDGAIIGGSLSGLALVAAATYYYFIVHKKKLALAATSTMTMETEMVDSIPNPLQANQGSEPRGNSKSVDPEVGGIVYEKKLAAAAAVLALETEMNFTPNPLLPNKESAVVSEVGGTHADVVPVDSHPIDIIPGVDSVSEGGASTGEAYL